MKRYGKELEFISWIKRDGSGTVLCGEYWDEKTPKTDDMIHLDNDQFELSRLSITYNTYIAHGFNSWVVKLKYVQYN